VNDRGYGEYKSQQKTVSSKSNSKAGVIVRETNRWDKEYLDE